MCGDAGVVGSAGDMCWVLWLVVLGWVWDGGSMGKVTGYAYMNPQAMNPQAIFTNPYSSWRKPLTKMGRASSIEYED